ncbi:MAG TPA: hypothetical protein VNH44_12660 [Micropepsaceae bacterium]|nr:hypothetical protein [Micropepsaceae bacterium]
MRTIHRRFLTATVISLCIGAAASAQPAPQIPDFSSNDRAWNRVGIPFLDPVTGKILFEDSEHPFLTRGVDAQGRDFNGTPNAPNWKDPNFKPWVAQKMKEYADEAIVRGKIRITPEASCWPGGTPGQMIFNEPLFILQAPTEVTLLYQRDHFVRHVYMNQPHSKNPKPSWFGESVGHYEGDELVVDTIGFNEKSDLDNWGTPHSDALHVIERYKMAEGGKGLRVTFTIDDPKAFNKPWSGVAVFRQVKGPMIEAVCAENNFDFFSGESYPMPEAKKVDF